MKETFYDVDFRGKNSVLLSKIVDIVDNYQSMGYKLTLRQLYYQLVSSDIIPNRLNEYSKLSGILTKARMGGYIDWDAIEDRVRVPKKHSEWDDIAGLVDSACASYRLPRWSDQKYYVELWTEKDAIAGILRPITDKYHITLVVNRGYSSATAMYDASKRIISASETDKECVILYLGDHDPSGLDMDRDIQERLGEFGASFTYTRIGLTWKQIQQYNPPPNPAKVSDPRAVKYIEQYGANSWEVDALKPDVLDTIVKSSISSLLDSKKYNDWIKKENADIKKLKDYAKKTK